MDTTLREAAELLGGDRYEAYGDPAEMWGRIAKLWTATLGFEVTPRQAVLCMMQVKISREIYRHRADTSTDLAAYAAILESVTH